MGLRSGLPHLGSPRRRVADLAAPIQLAPAAQQSKIKSARQPPRSCRGQPVEAPQLEPADPGRYSGLADVPPSAAHTTPWPRPRQSRGLWPEARWSEGAAPPSRPCRTGTAAPELKRSDDPPHAPWFASATHGPSVYPQPQPSGIPADPFSRSPYDLDRAVRLRSPSLAPSGIPAEDSSLPR